MCHPASIQCIYALKLFDNLEVTEHANWLILTSSPHAGHNLGDHTETKHRFLEESIMNLDSQNPATRHHMAAILGGLQKQLQTYIRDIHFEIALDFAYVLGDTSGRCHLLSKSLLLT